VLAILVEFLHLGSQFVFCCSLFGSDSFLTQVRVTHRYLAKALLEESTLFTVFAQICLVDDETDPIRYAQCLLKILSLLYEPLHKLE
jgi:hypothetical protein